MPAEDTSINDPGTISTSACLNPNDLYYQFDKDGNFSPDAVIHDQEACQQQEEHIPDSNIQADEDIPIPDVESQDKNELTEPKNNNVLIALAVLGGLFWL